jgi:hypothetical protein
MYVRLPLTLLILSIASTALHAQDDHRTYGFKGIHLGMTRAEVSTLVKGSGWGIQTSSGHRDDPIPSDKAFVVLNSDSPVPAVTRVEPRDLSALGCTGDSCAYFNWALLRFADDRVYQIIVLTANYSLSTSSVSFYVNAAISAIAGWYGDPVRVEEPIERTIEGLAESVPPTTLNIAEWRRTTDGKGESIVVQAKRFSRAHVCEVRIVMTDEEAFRNARAAVREEEEEQIGR